MPRALGALLATGLLAACGGLSALKPFGGDAEGEAPLPELTEPVAVDALWRENVGGSAKSAYLRLVPAVAEGRVFAAGYKGDLVALDAATGKAVWRQKTRLPITGGPGVGGGLVVVGSEDGVVAAYTAADGAFQWKTRVSSEVLAAPETGQGVSVVRTGDGRVFGLDAASGELRWTYDRAVPSLSLRGTSAPVITEDLVICGFDGGFIVAIRLGDGRIVWESRVVEPTGRSEIQRLADIDSEPVVVGRTVYAVSYQGNVMALDLDSAEVLWRRDMSSYSGLAASPRAVFVTDTAGVVWALDRATGVTLWSSEALAGRALSAPAVQGEHVAVGDAEGYVHWLRSEDGATAARTQVDGDGIVSRPTVAGETLYVLGNGGVLSALVIR